MSPESAVEAREVNKSFSGVVEVGPFSFEVQPGDRVALLGSNGSGKSTLLGLISGLMVPTSGVVTVFGHDAGSLPARKKLAYLSDTPALFEDISVREHCEYVAGLNGLRGWEVAMDDIASSLKMASLLDRTPRGLSRGSRQKASILLSLLRPFEILLADEPFNFLDAPSREGLAELLGETIGARTAIVVTHRLEDLPPGFRATDISALNTPPSHGAG